LRHNDRSAFIEFAIPLVPSIPTTHPYVAAAPFACFAHRGGAVENLENTKRAFAASAALGYRFIETDVQATSDGTVMVFHDDDLDRLTDGTGAVSGLPYAAVREARIGGTEPIMTLEELLCQFPEMHFCIDVKTDHALEPTLELVRRMNCLDRLCLASFSDKRLKRIRAEFGPAVCTGAGPKDVTALKFASWGAPRRPVVALCAQVPVRAYGIALVTPRFIRQCHAQGIVVHVWTIDEEAEMRRLIRLGVDGIMSDRPTLLKAVAIEEGVW
jgi:glycerophosphoryl diester phosphodiesterase